MREIIEWSQGNPGAMNFLMKFLEPENGVKGIRVLTKLTQLESIRGANLYVLYSDLCDKDLDAVVTLCQNCPSEILEDACSRQDYSGRAMVSKYLIGQL